MLQGLVEGRWDCLKISSDGADSSDNSDGASSDSSASDTSDSNSSDGACSDSSDGATSDPKSEGNTKYFKVFGVGMFRGPSTGGSRRVGEA